MNSVKDSDWLRRSFLISPKIVTNQDMLRRELTEASFKFTDTTLGGNFAINPPPQFTHRADIVVPSRFTKSSGQGRYYSEALDDRGQYVHMRFGVPQFNSLTGFFTGFYSPEAGSLANTGRGTSFFYDAGKFIGTIVSAPIQPFIWMGALVNFLSNKEASRYYYLKPAMPLYWNTVQTIVNTIGVNMGLVGKDWQTGEKVVKEQNDPLVEGAESKAIHDSMAGIAHLSEAFRKDGGIDIYAVANRAQRLAHQNRIAIQKVLESGDSWESIFNNMIDTSTSYMSNDSPIVQYNDYISNYHSMQLASPNDSSEGNESKESSEKVDWEGFEKDSFGDFLAAELTDGSAFVTFRVDDTGTINESFSNNTGEAGIASKLNSSTSSSRDTRFSIADGNIGEGTVLNAVEGFFGSAKDVISGLADSVSLGGLAALTGRAFADIPKVWTDSSADLPKMSYTIELRSPYGNPMSRYQNLYVPLAMLMAGALPLSTGKASYTSPFLVELYSQGRNQTRLGMIDSLTITRGSGNLGWTRNNEPLGIDVSFSVVDLSSVMHVPIVSKFNDILPPIVGGATELNTFDDDNTFTDYMAVLGGLSLADQIYPVNKLRLRSALRKAEWQKMNSPAYHANWMAGTALGQISSAVFTTSLNFRN